MIDLGLECFQFTNKQMPFRPLRVKLYQVHILNGLNDNIYIWFWGRGESQSIWFLQSYLWPKSRVDFVSDSYDLTSDRWIGWIMPWTHSTIKLWAKSRVDFVSDSLYDLTSDRRAGWILSRTRCTILPLTKKQGGFCLGLVVRSYLWPKRRVTRVEFVSDSLYDLTSDRRAGWILSRTRCRTPGSSRWSWWCGRYRPDSPAGYESTCCLCTARGFSVKINGKLCWIIQILCKIK